MGSTKEDYKWHHDLHKQALRDNKIKITNARLARTKAKKKLSNDYDRLKQDKLADKGKDLYSKGNTIRGLNNTSTILGVIGGLSLGAAFRLPNKQISVNVGNSKKTINTKIILGAIGAGTLGSAAVVNAVGKNRSKKLRAYYSHSSKR